MDKNKMGTEPIPKLVISMSLPTIFAMLVQALYNVVDSIFVSRISDTNNDGLTAISLAFPVQLIVIAVFVGLGVGMNALISRRLGEKNPEGAVLVAENGVLIGLVVYALVAVLGVIFARPFLSLFTENLAVIDYGVTYVTIIMIFAFGRIMGHAGNSIFQGTGEMVIPMITMLIGAVLNIILDPILIFGYFGFAAMGVKGAAIATVVAQIVAMIFVWSRLIFGKNLIKLNLRGFVPHKEVIGHILMIGVPVAFMQGLGSVMLTGYNLILSQFGDVAIDVMGAYFRLQSMVFMPVFGLSTGTMPIIGYNYGAKNKKRIAEAVKFSTIVAVSFLTLSFIVFQIIPARLLGMYNPSEEMLTIGVKAFRAISLIFPTMGVTIIMNTAFQAFGKAHYSLITSVVRQLVVLLPVAWLLSLAGNLDIVWYSFLVAELVGVTVVIFLYRKTFREGTAGWE